ncbi:MAG: NAD(P)/FAD-dependent oxidoreductase [Candidatus Parabeggiatoa sp.]|nr:NAD(P)/FAD-dependent oxidoreductase [Candidatus Parabeggiatoa sp.]
MPSFNSEFDLIIIGSGMGSMTCAALMAKLFKKKVLVLEQHFVVGGFTHEFARKNKYQWDVGLHYVGEMQKGLPRQIMDFITDKQLQWHKMPAHFEKFVYPDFSFWVPDKLEKYIADLIERFPNEAAAIKKYFRDVSHIAMWWSWRHHLAEVFPLPLRLPVQLLNRFYKNKALQTTEDYLSQHFQDEKLKALLASQWGDYGLPPSQSAFVIHAAIVHHYFNGGYYPVGGAQKIAKNIRAVVEKAGGQFLTRRAVTEIIVKNNQAIGVKVNAKTGTSEQEEEYFAPIIVSGVGAVNTFLRLVPHSSRPSFIEEIKAFPKGSSALSLYIAFKESPEKLGFKGENHWIFEHYEHNQALKGDTLLDSINYCFLSFPSLKDPESKIHTAEIVKICDCYAIFEKWQAQEWKQREAEYYELKEQITEKLLNLVEKHYPGFKALVEYTELSTPLTLEHFSHRLHGAMYGMPAIPAKYDKKWLSAKTPIKNLYLTGSDVWSLGIAGAMMGGVVTASLLAGKLGFFKIVRGVKRNV